jgi:hypothetical protein
MGGTVTEVNKDFLAVATAAFIFLGIVILYAITLSNILLYTAVAVLFAMLVMVYRMM